MTPKNSKMAIIQKWLTFTAQRHFNNPPYVYFKGFHEKKSFALKSTVSELLNFTNQRI